MSFPFLQPYAGLSNSLQTAQAAGVAPADPSGGWVELARTTLGSANSSIEVTGLADKRYYMILVDQSRNTASDHDYYRTGNGSFDTGSNYAHRANANGAGDVATTSASSVKSTTSTSNPHFHVLYGANLSNKEKLFQGNMVQQISTGAGTTPQRQEQAFKWANTSNSLDRFSINTTNSDTYDAGSELVVLGWDPADTHSSNFWEELASVELTVAGDSLDSGTFTAKKYLCIQAYFSESGQINPKLHWNGDTGTNYCERTSRDGGAESVPVNQPHHNVFTNTNEGIFMNLFVINNTSNEKLITGHVVTGNAAGAATAPRRQENTFKWANTSSQITRIDFSNNGSGDFNIGSIVKVWGSD
jgi:hypothetical protein